MKSKLYTYLKKLLIFIKENFLILLGTILAIISLSIPVILLLNFNRSFNLKKFEQLGTVGDFFGGTTVGLLTLSSIVFVAATIVIQKKELEMQREELTRTREEFELSNQTLIKQQFENTFFNMINLHHNILNDMKKEGGEEKFETGRDAIESVYNELKTNYYNNHKFMKKNIENISRDLLNNDESRLVNIAFSLYLASEKRAFINRVSVLDHNIYNENYELVREVSVEEVIETIIQENNEEWLDMKKNITIEFNDYLAKNKKDLFQFFSSLSFVSEACVSQYNIKDLFKYITNENAINFLIQLRHSFLDIPSYESKSKLYEEVYNYNEPIIGHYFRNLYRIVKFIQDQNFSKDKHINEIEKRKYRGILRAQLSSIELLMLFYNISYSRKGEKFKKLISNENFFDDHLSPSKFIWKNDNEQLEELT